MTADILKFTEIHLLTKALKSMSITNTIKSLAPILITVVISEIVLNRKTCESCLIFEGRLTKTDGTAYANAEEVALTNNAMMHLFNRIEYHLSNLLNKSLRYPSQATTMLGLLKYSDEFSKAQGLHQLWYRDTATTASKADNNGFTARRAYLIQSPTVKRKFYFRIPLKYIFGFCVDYDKILYVLKHSLTIVRKTYDNAIFRAAQLVLEKSV